MSTSTPNEIKMKDAYQALMNTFIEECKELPPRGKKSIDFKGKRIAVWKDEDYDEMFDVIFTFNGYGDDNDIYDGTHFDELEGLVENLLFQSPQISDNVHSSE